MKQHLLPLMFCATLCALSVEPSATLFENDQVKVLRALEKPHVKGHFHEHTMDRVMIYLEGGRQRFEYQGGKPAAEFNWKAGEVKWSPAGGMHAPEVITDAPFNIVEVELKKPGTGKGNTSRLDPVKVDRKHYKVEFENDRVRVIRVTIGPHESAPLHEHAINRLSVFLTDQDFRITDTHNKVEMSRHKAGDVVWGTPTTHKEENLSDKPFEVIVVELKS